MSTPEQLKQIVSKSPQTLPIEAIVEKYHKNLAKVLPHHMNIDRVKGIVFNAIRTNPNIQKCTHESLLGSVFALAQLGLEPIGGRAYLIPFQNKRKIDNEWKTLNEVQAIIGYAGYADLFYRHSSSLSLNWGIVCDNDFFEYEYGTDQYLRHRPAEVDRGNVKGYYVVAKLKGASVFKYMTKQDCMAHGQKHSKTFVIFKWEGKNKVPCDPHFDEKSPWSTDPDSMCLKTVLRQLQKLLPLSVELQRAFEVDETSRELKEGVIDAFSVPSTTAWQEEGNDPKIEKPAAKPAGGSIEG